MNELPKIHPFDAYDKIPPHPRGYHTKGDIVEIEGKQYELTTDVPPITTDIA